MKLNKVLVGNVNSMTRDITNDEVRYTVLKAKSVTPFGVDYIAIEVLSLSLVHTFMI